ncbi:MAG: glycosyltransferase family 4 protein [Anaerolineales bacterium]|nr:glycosyltransferase family 4 protein [Anaerolineales bacterium]
MKALFFANTDWYLYNFRLPLLKAVQERGLEVVLVCPPGEYLARLEEQGFRCEGVSLSRSGMNPLAEAATIFRLVRLYRRERPALAHHFTVKCVLYGSLAARLNRVATVVNAVTGLGYVFTGGGWRKHLLQTLVANLYRLILGGSQVVFQNPDDRQAFLDRRLVRAGATHLIQGSGVDVSAFRARPLPGGVPLVVLAARMLWDKGVGEFVAAARALKAQGLEARFALVGDTYDGNPAAVPSVRLQAWAEEGVVEWWGWQEDMPAVYAGAHIVCLPSYREGLPRSLIEAAACGRAIVATDVPGCRQAVRAGQTGLLVPPREVPPLAAALATLLLDRSLCREMGAAGRLLAEQEFSTDRVIHETLAVYALAGMKGL